MPSRFVEVTTSSAPTFNFSSSLPPFSLPNVTLPTLNQTTLHALTPRSSIVHLFVSGLVLLALERLWVWVATRRFLAEFGNLKEKGD